MVSAKGWTARWAPLLLTALLVPLLLAALPGTGWGQSSNLYFLTLKTGRLDPTVSGDDFFAQVETNQGHGPLQGDREVDPVSIELDIYAIGGDRFGLGVGLELLRYDREFTFQDGTRLNLVVKGVHFTLKTFFRLGSTIPFVGAGIGNYYANVDQTGGLSLRDSPDDVFNFRVGLFVLLGRVSVMVETGLTRAMLEIPGFSGPARLELGGAYTNVGISLVF